MEIVDCIYTEERETPLESHSCTVYEELRRSGQLCDVVMKTETREFPVHRAIMSASSTYFRSLFTQEVCSTDQKEVVIPGITADIMEIFVEYAYTREAKITAENIERLLPAADQFHVNGLVRACCQFLAKSLEPENCIGIYNFAKMYFCHNLQKLTYRYLMLHFSEVATESAELLQLTFDEISSVLGSDDLNVKNEEMTFMAVLRWIDYDAPNRKCHIAPLLKTVRLGLISIQYFTEKVKNHPYVKESDICKPIVIETLKFLYDLDMNDKAMDLANPLARPRIPHEVLFVVGGWSGGSPTNVVETYDPRADKWTVCDTVDTYHRAYHGTVTLDKRIYIIGGFDGVEYFNTVLCFNPMTMAWSDSANMHSKRCYVSTAVLDDTIYAMGGYNGHDRLKTVEKYQPTSNQWSIVTEMGHERSDANATSLKGKIYICGGFDGRECLHTAEFYDPITDQWTSITPMRNKRSGVGVIAYQDQVYALGGFNGSSRMNTAERFDPASSKWQTIAEMYNPRSNFGVEVIDDMVFAIGGFNGVTTISSVECFDNLSNEWFEATDMNLYRSALSACVVHGLPNIHDYIHGPMKTMEASEPEQAEGTTAEEEL
ncbi:kelch-like protein 10 [Mizuhopecten yessoensis]|uniref:Kelch-like protein 10 n=1 Tax=Mizuhopecten yessoensis TaxID=6573 RepID=A0A210QDN8_MIZYE|nr:kelch-like protein 10 [Mizuhopecten yessoensis]OWF46852.1 Kelch-like protein 10 [Mizuhopecten yessoensis]